MYIVSSTDRLFRYITIHQCSKTHKKLQAGGLKPNQL